MKRFLINIFAALLVFAACVKEEPVSISFNSVEYQINVGDTLDLAAELVVANYDKIPLMVASDDSIVDLKSDGRLIALVKGEVEVTAIAGDIEAKCTVVIADVPLEKVTLTAPENIVAGDIGSTVTALVEPKSYNMNNLVWSFSASPQTMALEYESVKPGEYKVKVKDFVKDGKVTAIVAGKDDASIADTVVMTVVKDAVLATRISLDMPARLTGGVEGLWAPVKASVEPAEYDIENLVWTFTSSEGLEFETRKSSGGEYEVSIANYVRGGKLQVEVKDAFSATFNSGEISVLERPENGVNALAFKTDRMDLYLGDDPWRPELVCDPETYDPYLLKWTVSDETVVALETVDSELSNGSELVVRPLKDGTATLKVKDIISGKEAACEISVAKAVRDADIVKIEVDYQISLRLGEDVVQLNARCYDASNNIVENYTELEWTADKVEDAFETLVDIVEVSDRGVVTPKRAGWTQITVSDKKNPGVYAICQVTVLEALVKVKEVKFSKASIIMATGRSIALEATALPENAADKTITFTSKDIGIATVSEDGVVTGVSEGETDIVATASNGVSAQCHVKVADRIIFFDETDLVMAKGARKELVLSRIPEDGFKGNVEWTSTAPGVVKIEGGVLEAVSEGTATVTAKLDGFIATCAVKVVADDFGYSVKLVCDKKHAAVAVEGLQQDETVRYVPEFILYGEEGKTYIPANVKWTSSNPNIASVDNDGNVTAVKQEIKDYGLLSENKVTITFRATGGEASVEVCVVKAQPKEIIIKSMPSVNGVEGKIMHGASFEFETEVFPAKAIQDVAFILSDPEGKYAAGGKTFYAAKVGVYKITAYVETAGGTAESSVKGCQKHFEIEVLPVPVESFAIVGNNELALEVGDEMFLQTEILPENASFRTVSWSSSAEGVVIVGQNGKVEAVGPGEAVIQGLLPEGRSVEYKVIVTEPERSAAVGDFYYSDGTISSGYYPSKTIVGIVFSTQNISLLDSALPAECKNGLVVSLEEASTAWQKVDLSVDSWVKENIGHDDLTNYDLACGYSNTVALKEYNAENPASKVLLLDHEPQVSLPAGTSGWYIPSYEELNMMIEAYETIKDKFEAAGGLALSTEMSYAIGGGTSIDGYRYWASTESTGSSSWACAVQFHENVNDRKGHTNLNKSRDYYRVRYIFAF